MAPNDQLGTGLLSAFRQVVRNALQSATQLSLEINVALPAPATTSPHQTGATVELPAALAQEAIDAVVEVVAGHARALGVPARPLVSVRRAAVPYRVPRVHVAGRRVRVRSTELDAALATGDPPAGAHPGEDPVTLAAMACQVAIENDPSILLGPQQSEVLIAQARSAGLEPADDMLGAMLRRVIAHGYGLANLTALRDPLNEQTGLAQTVGELAEVAMDALGGPSLEIRLSEPTLRTATLSETRQDSFVMMRQRLFRDLGLTYPDIAIVIDPQVPERAAVVRLNQVRYAPRPLRGPGVLPIVALLEHQLRSHPSWFISLTEVRRTIDELRLALPDLVAAVLERYGESQLSLFARTFAQERMPVRNAARLMVLLLDAQPPSSGHDVVRLAQPSRVAGQRAHRPGPHRLVSYTRQQMNEEAARARPGLTTVTHTRLPADLDAALEIVQLTDTGVDEVPSVADLDRLIDVAERLLEEAPVDGEGPTLVTATQHSRSVASRLLARQYPEIAVIAAEEYPPTNRLAPPDGRKG